jgi:hypothetical protein
MYRKHPKPKKNIRISVIYKNHFNAMNSIETSAHQRGEIPYFGLALVFL